MISRRQLIARFVIPGVILFICAIQPIRSQEMWGIVNSNYAGSNAALINPASLVNSKVYLDINLVTADFFFENNYLYIHREDYRPFKFLKKDAEFPAYRDAGNPFDRFANKSLKNVYQHIRIQGPSFMLALGNHSFAFHTSLRSITSMRRIPYDLANFGYEDLSYEPQHNINYNNYDFYLTNLEWMEIGATYSAVLYKEAMDRVTAGISLKFLMGFAGAYAGIRNFNYIVLNDSTLDIRNLDAEVGLSIPVDYDNNDIPDGGKLIKGTGIGADIGISYVRTKRGAQRIRYRQLCAQRYPDYYFKLGASLLDIGYINFRHNAQVHSYNNVGALFEEIDTVNYYNMNEFTRYVSDRVYGDPDASLIAEKLSVILPSAISVQADYQFIDDWYINGTAVMPLRFWKNAIYRPSQIAITPRYEHRIYEIAFPVSLYDFTKPRLGVAGRIGFLTIGTDNLLGFTPLKNFTGFDIYFSIKINFNKGFCGRTRGMECQNQEYGIRRK